MHAASRHGTPSLTSLPKDGGASCFWSFIWKVAHPVSDRTQPCLTSAKLVELAGRLDTHPAYADVFAYCMRSYSRNYISIVLNNDSDISSDSSLLSLLADYKALCPGGTGTATNGTMITGVYSTFIVTVSSGLESVILSTSTNVSSLVILKKTIIWNCRSVFIVMCPCAVA